MRLKANQMKNRLEAQMCECIYARSASRRRPCARHTQSGYGTEMLGTMTTSSRDMFSKERNANAERENPFVMRREPIFTVSHLHVTR